MHDGGAEGFIEPELFEDPQAIHFLQVSKQETYRRKIRDTVARLRRYGRAPQSLVYFTSKTIQDIDILEEEMSDELSCRVLIRDCRYIEDHVNRNDATVAAFDAYIRPNLSYLYNPGNVDVAPRTATYTDRTLAVFLRQEVEHRRGQTDLLDAVSDSLILWSLSDTDPDQNKLMSRDEILSKIELALPSARRYIRGVLDARLNNLRRKDRTDGRQIRYYNRDGGLYCLPFETRELVAAENIEDESLKTAVTKILTQRCVQLLEDENESLVPNVVSVCHDVLQRLFERQGLQVALFVTDGDLDDEVYANAAALIIEVIDENLSFGGSSEAIRRLSTKVLRGTFYDGTDEERQYLEKLSRTYVLLLTLRNEPKIVEYFKTISSKFNLYIGTDFLVRAFSEYFLEERNQTTHNLFKILKSTGAKLILTEKVVSELATHLRAQIFEFESSYAHIENRITLSLVEYIDRILIRSYFYSRLAPISGITPPIGFKSFIEKFASYAAIRSGNGDTELARYLISKFEFEYETTEDMREGVDPVKVDALANLIASQRGGFGKSTLTQHILAENDALQVYAIYAKRRKNQEGSPANPFGYRTWWLTQDGSVRRAALPVITAHGGHRFMMRPEFLLNFIYLAPSTTLAYFIVTCYFWDSRIGF